MHVTSRRRPTVVLAALVTGVATLAAPAGQAAAAPDPLPHRGAGDPGGISMIMPPGQQGGVTGPEALAAQNGELPSHFNDQTALYEGLLQAAALPGDPAAAGLGYSDGDERTFFHDGSFGVEGPVERTYSPGDRDDVVVERDAAFGIPHITGTTREGTMFGVGYATAEDRLFLMDALRHVGRARLSEFLGASEANKRMDREQLLIAPYREDELTAQLDALEARGPEGQLIVDDGLAYTEGVNQYISEVRANPAELPVEYPALQVLPEDFVPEDIVAIASLVGGIFGRGGGGEVRSAAFRQVLLDELGDERGQAVWEDLRSAEDPEAPVTTDREFPYNNPTAQLDDGTTVVLERDSLQPAYDEDAGTPDPFDVGALLDPNTFGALPLPDELTGGLGDAGDVLGTASLDALAPGVRATEQPRRIDGPFGPIDLGNGFAMSNALLATADASDGGTPAVVFGPQTGYFTPQLLVETDVHGPGIDARGVAFSGTNIYVQLGRGADYAWSATSAGADLADQWAVELCEPDGSTPSSESTSYVYDGECRPMDVYTHRQLAKPTAAGTPDPSAQAVVVDYEVRRTVYGPVQGYGSTADGTPHAFAEQRSTYGDELGSAIGFQRINDPDFMSRGDDVTDFREAFFGVDFTFNWFYVDDDDIAYQHSCRCPLRDPATDPDLPTRGDGEHDWLGQEPQEGFYTSSDGAASALLRGGDLLARDAQPHDANPERGFIVSWNNKQAPGFRANDSQYSYSSTYRSEFLRTRIEERLERVGRVSTADMVRVVQDAGTADLNGNEIFPLLLRVLDESDVDVPSDLQPLVALLRDWVATDAHRRDADADGTYDDATAVALGDALLRPLLSGALDDELGSQTFIDIPQKVEDHPRLGLGSAFNGGQANTLDKLFRQTLGDDVEGPYQALRCGDDLDGCAQVVLDALVEARELLGSSRDDDDENDCAFPDAYRFGSDDPDDWVYDARCDDIDQSALGVVDAPDMQWVNRPTFQQVVQLGSRAGRLAGDDRVATAAALSRHGFPGGADDVVIATSRDFPDALAGTPLAASLDGPVLLVGPQGPGPQLTNELERLGAQRAVVLGGTSAVPEDVVAGLEDLDLEVRRVAGGTRYETAVAVAEELDPDGSAEQVLLASGADFPDALSAGPWAAATGTPILLTQPDVLSAATSAALQGRSDAGLRVAGGPNAIADAVVAATPQGGSATRTAGATRYETAVAFADLARQEGAEATQTFLASGADFPDALAAGPAVAAVGGQLLLTRADVLSEAAGRRLTADADDVLDLWFAGGQNAVSPAVREAAEQRIGPDPR